MSGDIALNPFTPNKTPAMPDLVQANSSHSNPTSPWSYAHHRDDLSARQCECEDAPRRAAKELRWQAWSTAWKDLEDGQWRISCVSSVHLYMSPKNRDEETLSRWVSMICLTTCWRNACCQRTHRGAILTSVKWYAPTSKTGSTAMGDLQCVFVHLCCRDLPTSTPCRSLF